MKKVVEFVYSLYDGGAENLVKQYCFMLDKTEFSPIVLTLYPNYDSSAYQSLSSNNITIYNIYPKRSACYRLFNKTFGKLYFSYKLKKIIKKEKVDVIHCHTAVLRYIRYAKKYLTGIKLLYTCHSIPERYFTGYLKDEYRSAVYLLEHNYLQLIALHEDMRNQLNRLFGINNTVVINNGIDLIKYQNIKKSKKEIRDNLGISSNAYVIGHLGRFSEPKNHDFLVRIFIEAKKQKKNAFLFMIGDGVLKKHIENILCKNGLENDYLILSNRSDIPELLKAMDVFVFPSKVEGFGIALIEAQAVGLKCITSSAIPDAACVTNLVIKKSLSDSVKDWCSEILSDTSNYNDLSKLEKYNIRKEIKKLESLYR